MSNKILSVFPFIATARDYNFSKFRADLMAALTVAVIALPQSMAYAIIAGIHPKYGLYAAIVPVIIASLFGSSRFLIAGPTNAVSMVVASSMTVMAAGTVTQNFSEVEKIAIIFSLAFLVGIIQLVLGIIKFGNLMNFVSHSVIVGFTAGAGVLIAFNQLKNFLGIVVPNNLEFIHLVKEIFLELPHTHLPSFALGLATIIFIIIIKKISKKIPPALIAMASASVLVWILGLDQHGVRVVGEISRTLPPLSYPVLSLDFLRTLLQPAIAVAILAIVESLSIAKSIASQSGDRLDANQELIGQGLANISAAFTSSIPGTGSFTRSAVNFKSGAQTRFAGVFSAMFVLAALLILAPLARYIPVASLAGIIMVVAYTMIDKEALKLSWRANTSDRVVLIVTMLSALLLELSEAIYLGVFISIILFLRKVSVPQVEKVAPRTVGEKFLPITAKNPALVCSQIGVYQIRGSIFFGAASELEDQMRVIRDKQVKVVILRMNYIRIVDATGVHAFLNLLEEMHRQGVRVILSGTQDGVMRVLCRTGIVNTLGEENVCLHMPEAITQAYKFVDKNICKNCTIRAFRECV